MLRAGDSGQFGIAVEPAHSTLEEGRVALRRPTDRN